VNIVAGSSREKILLEGKNFLSVYEGIKLINEQYRHRDDGCSKQFNLSV
jgi:hypothetical protein